MQVLIVILEYLSRVDLGKPECYGNNTFVHIKKYILSETTSLCVCIRSSRLLTYNKYFLLLMCCMIQCSIFLVNYLLQISNKIVTAFCVENAVAFYVKCRCTGYLKFASCSMSITAFKFQHRANNLGGLCNSITLTPMFHWYLFHLSGKDERQQ